MSFIKDWQHIKTRIVEAQRVVDDIVISPKFVEFLITAEDHRFGSHPGVDPIALCRAFWRSTFCGKREGGSTIAMQLVIVLSGKYNKTLTRKLMEICLAVRLNCLVSDSELPKLYLVVAYFGWRMNGLKQAGQLLGLDLSSASAMDAAKLIARLKYPEPKNCSLRRAHQILSRAEHIIQRSIYIRSKIIHRPSQLVKNNGSI